MTQCSLQNMYQLQIKLMLAFNPALFFNRLNKLDWYKGALHQWIEKLMISPNSKILDVGCETGSLCAFMKDSGFIPTGVDMSDAMINKAKRHHGGIDFLVANAHSLGFENGIFDGVVSASLINIVSEPKQVISELTRVCSKGGMISVLFPRQGFSDADLDTLVSSLGITRFSKAALVTWHRLAPKRDVDQIKSLLEDAGVASIITRNYLNGMVVSVSGQKESG